MSAVAGAEALHMSIAHLRTIGPRFALPGAGGAAARSSAGAKSRKQVESSGPIDFTAGRVSFMARFQLKATDNSKQYIDFEAGRKAFNAKFKY